MQHVATAALLSMILSSLFIATRVLVIEMKHHSWQFMEPLMVELQLPTTANCKDINSIPLDTMLVGCRAWCTRSLASSEH
jgi:hypothetical protein